MADGALHAITAANGSAIFKLQCHKQREAGRRNLRALHNDEASFMLLTPGLAGDGGLATAANDEYMHATAPYAYVSMAGQGLHTKKKFTERVLQHLANLHMAVGAELGMPVPSNTIATSTGTTQLRRFDYEDPPPMFDSSREVRCNDPTLRAGSTFHTDSPYLYPALFKAGGPLWGYKDVGGDDDDDDDDSDDEGDEEHSWARGPTPPPSHRAIINTGPSPFSMLVSVPNFMNGEHVACSKLTGKNSQFHLLEVQLKPGEAFIFREYTGVVMAHQAAFAATARVSFVVIDYNLMPGAPGSCLAAPTAAGPVPWADWRIVSCTAAQAKGSRGGEEWS